MFPKRSDREFLNSFEDYDDNSSGNEIKMISDVSDHLKSKILAHLDVLNNALFQLDPSDSSVYTGTAGIAFLYYKLSQQRSLEVDHHVYLSKCLTVVEPSLRKLKRKRLTFLCGDTGPLCIAAVCYHKLGQTMEYNDCIERVLSRLTDIKKDSVAPDALLYGRAGFLYSLLFIRHHIGNDRINDDIIKELCNLIIKSGQDCSQREKFPCPLMYEWHDKKYLGAAHGLAGILYILMLSNLSEEELHSLVKPSLDYCLSLKFASGNMPSSIGSTHGDRLVHWCHGAPGWVHTCIKAYVTFGDERYLNEALSMNEAIWTRGLLCKGYGLCHGVAGNAYSCLAIYQVTKNLKYLHRAIKFAEWCCNYGKHGCRTADRPYSLFEGMAGMIFFLVDVLNPLEAQFPAFESFQSG